MENQEVTIEVIKAAGTETQGTNTSRFSKEVYDNLPPIIRQLSAYFDDSTRHKDIFLFSILHLLSACMPNIVGTYFGKRLSPNMYGMVGGPPGTGKSAMDTVMSLANPIIKRFSNMYKARFEEYKLALLQYKISKTPPKPEPPEPILFVIPGNSSNAGVIRLLSNSQYAIVAETEADSLGNMLRQKNFDWSDLLRKAYHHEPYTYYRKTDNEYIELKDRRLSLLLTGTPQQLRNLIRGPENGLFSRIGFYVYDERPCFVSPFKKEHTELTAKLLEYSKEVEQMFFHLYERPTPIEFTFTEEQKGIFERKFAPIVDQFYDMSGSDAASIAMRLGVIFFRIAMVLSVLRGYDSDIIVCNDTDFENAGRMIDLMAEHAVVVLSSFPEDAGIMGVIGSPQRIIEELPKGRFHIKEIRELFIKAGYSKRTVFRVITQLEAKGLIRRVAHGTYEKL